MSAVAPLVLINAVGLTGRLLAMAPRLHALAESGWSRAVARGRARPSPARRRRPC